MSAGCIGLVALVLGAATAPVCAQTVSDKRVWTGVFAQGRVRQGSRWRWALDTLFRTRDVVDTVDVAGVRLTISRDLTGRSSVGMGYALAVAFPDQGEARTEHRIHQQYLWNRAAGRGALSLRTRVEERFFEGNDGVVVRGRQQVRFSWPVSAGGTRSLVVADEVFAHGNTTALTTRGFDSNRLFGGMRLAITPGADVEVGYVHVYGRSRSGPHRVSHVLSAAIAARF